MTEDAPKIRNRKNMADLGFQIMIILIRMHIRVFYNFTPIPRLQRNS